MKDAWIINPGDSRMRAQVLSSAAKVVVTFPHKSFSSFIITEATDFLKIIVPNSDWYVNIQFVFIDTDTTEIETIFTKVQA